MKVLLIPSAKLIDQELQSRFGEIPACLVPVNGKAILERTYEKSKDLFDKIVVVGYEESLQIENFVQLKMMDIEVVVLDQLKDLLYSISKGLGYIINSSESAKDISVVINLADTLIDEKIYLLDGIDKLFYTTLSESKRWTTFDISKEQITRFYEKVERDGSEFNVVVGVYHINNLRKFYSELEVIRTYSITDCFHNALIKYNPCIEGVFLEKSKWMDIGHLDKYMSSVREVQSRYFNSIEVDRIRGVLTKRSDDLSKFRNEILWYLKKMPLRLQYLTPRIFNYSLEFDNMFVQMEYYGYNTLNELFVYGNLSKYKWQEIFKTVFNVIEDMQQYVVNCNTTDIEISLNKMYIGKTLARIKSLKNDNFFP